jgi:general stress protein YciG
MPNNNPSGHNQYTRRREQQLAQQAPDARQTHSIDPSSSAAGDARSRDETSRDETSRDETSESTPESTAVSAGFGPSDVTTSSIPHTPAKRGFAAMDEATQRTIASKGGQSQGKGNNPGNFANDRDRAREAGRKGGEAHGHRSSTAPAPAVTSPTEH